MLFAWRWSWCVVILLAGTYGSQCPNSSVTVEFSHAKMTFNGDDGGSWVWQSADDIRIIVTPDEPHPDMEVRAALFEENAPDICVEVQTSSDIGGSLLVVAPSSATKTHLTVSCKRFTGETCSVHIALSNSSWNAKRSAKTMTPGEIENAVAYHGVAMSYVFTCDAQCSKASQLQVSVWPREVNSLSHLSLLVARKKPPTSNTVDRLAVTKGWFGGEVMSTKPEKGDYYITVLRKHGRRPMPFQLVVKLPNTVETVAIEDVTFGSVAANASSYYKFFVGKPNSDIEVYVYNFSGTVDVGFSQAGQLPTLETAQWSQRGGSELIVSVTDPVRVETKAETGWFNVVVRGATDAAFAMVILTERHIEATDTTAKIIVYEYLLLGIPMRINTSPGHAVGILHQNDFPTPALTFDVQVVSGTFPKLCADTCGTRLHSCPAVSPDSVNASSPEWRGSSLIAHCENGRYGDQVYNFYGKWETPCLGCWQTLYIATPDGNSTVDVVLGAEGQPHPLTEGEPFMGEVDAGEAPITLGYLVEEHDAGAMLNVALTVGQGDPYFTMHEKSEDELGPAVFNSGTTGSDVWRGDVSSYADVGEWIYFSVAARLRHSQFSFMVYWSPPPTDDPPQTTFSHMAPRLLGGEPMRGRIEEGVTKPDVYQYSLTIMEGGHELPGFTVSATSVGAVILRLYVLAFSTGQVLSNYEKASFSQDPASLATWQSEMEPLVVVNASDPKLASMYLVAVAPLEGSESSFEYTIVATADDDIQDLPNTGLQFLGSVQNLQEKRYRLELPMSEVAGKAKASSHLAVTVQQLYGETRVSLAFRGTDGQFVNFRQSRAFGDKVLFVPSFARPLKDVCEKDVLVGTNASCRIYVIVTGNSFLAKYKISATTPSGDPVFLALGEMSTVALPAGHSQWLYFPVVPSSRRSGLSLVFSARQGVLSSISGMVTNLASAKDPIALSKIDFEVAELAGSEVMTMKAEDLDKFCAHQDDASSGGCAVLVRVVSGSRNAEVEISQDAYIGWVHLVPLENISTGEPEALRQSTSALALQSGVPVTSTITQSAPQKNFTFDLPAGSSMKVSVRADCLVQLTLESAPNGRGEKHVATYPLDPLLRLISVTISTASVSRVTGIYHLTVASSTSLDNRTCMLSIEATSVFGDEVPVSFLEANAPQMVSDTGTQHFVFNNERGDAGDGDRSKLKVRVRTVSGNIRVSYQISTFSDGEDSVVASSKSYSWHSLPQTGPDFTLTGLDEKCDRLSSCEIVIEVVSVKGEVADYEVTLLNDLDLCTDRGETIELGMPVLGHLDAASCGATYHVVVGDRTDLHVEVSCSSDPGCVGLILSADTQSKFPELTSRQWVQRDTDVGGMLHLSIPKPLRGDVDVAQVLIRLEFAQPGGRPVDFRMMVTSSVSDAMLLLDGDRPVHTGLEPSEPKYFYFDSRSGSSLLTLTATVQPDSRDPYDSLVNFYVLDCVTPSTTEDLHKDEWRPSAERWDLKGFPNGRGQNVVLISPWSWHLHPSQKKVKPKTTSSHCYYPIAIISNRMTATSLSLQGTQSREFQVLPVGQVLHGIIEGTSQLSYEVEPQEDLGDFLSLSLEVCSGSVSTMLDGAQEVRGGFDNLPVPLHGTRRFWLSVTDGAWATFIITAKDRSSMRLEPTTKKLNVRQATFNTVVVTWEPASVSVLAGSPVPDRVTYEVFFKQDTVHSQSNFSSPCGLYQEYQLSTENDNGAAHLRKDFTPHINRINARSGLQSTVYNLEPDSPYTFNVVARSGQQQLSVAYEATHFRTMAAPAQTLRPVPGPGPRATMAWSRSSVLLVLVFLAVCLCWRCYIRGASLPSWGSVELPPLGHQRTPQMRNSTHGGYAPPEMSDAFGESPSVIGGSLYSQEWSSLTESR